MESELKFDIDAIAADALSKRLGLGEAGRPQSLRSVYFDTPSGELRAHGLTLRVRDDGRKRVQTVKKARSNGLSRGEWEQVIKGPGPDLKAAANTPLAGLLGHGFGEALRPAFETRVDRTILNLPIDDAVIEVALDRGVVDALGTDAPILELELELKKGPLQALFVLARELSEVARLNLSFVSKAERGYALLDGEPLAPVRASDLALDRRDDAQTAFKVIAGAALAQIAANARVLRRVRRIEALHQARVGARRLRSALSLFRPMLEDGRLDTVKAELKWLTHELDEARNLDVFIAETFRPAARRHPAWPGLAAFGKGLITAQTDAYARAMAAIESDRFRALMLETAAWIETGPWTASDDPAITLLRARPVRRVASEILEDGRRKIARKGRKLARLRTRPRHKLRIDAKKLRYACGFFASLYPGKRLEAYSRVMADLQDTLGATIDIAAAESLSARLALPDGRAEPAFAAGLIGGERQAAAANTLKAAEKAFRRFKTAKPFW